MQHGRLIRATRQHGPDVWDFRWREPGGEGKRKHRRIVLGSTEQLLDRQAIAAIEVDINHIDVGTKGGPDHSLAAIESLSSARVGAGQDLENALDQSDI